LVAIFHLKLQIVSLGRKTFSADFQLMFRLLKLFLFIGIVVILILMFTLLSLTVSDIFVSLLAFMPTGWAFIQVLLLVVFSSCLDVYFFHLMILNIQLDLNRVSKLLTQTVCNALMVSLGTWAFNSHYSRVV